MTEVEFIEGEGIGRHNFHQDKVVAAVAFMRIVRCSQRRRRLWLQKLLGKRRGRRVFAKFFTANPQAKRKEGGTPP